MATDNSRDETVATTPQDANVDFDIDATRTVVQPLTPVTGASTGSGSHVALPLGFPLQEYTIEAVLGVGGFGITYLARDNNLQCRVAIKEYLPNDLAIRLDGKTVIPRSDGDADNYRIGLARFLAEARVLATFRHHNIVRVARFFEAHQTAYMVMDYEHGESLRSWREKHGPPDEATLKRMFLPLLDGLETVHAAGVVHRDIKPANIYVRDADGSLVLLDFGAARQTAGGASKSLTSIVTPGYAPFEQYHARGAQGPWSDLYALAGVLYWLVTGQKPLEAPSRVKSDSMAPAAAAGAGRFSPGFLAAIDWALTVDEETRPRSVAEFRPALLGEAPVQPRPGQAASAAGSLKATGFGAPPAATGKRGPSRFVAIGIAGAVVAVAAAFFALKPPAPLPVASGDGKLPPTASPESAERRARSDAPAAVAVTPAAKAKKVQPPARQAASSAAAAGPHATLLFEIVPPGEQGEVTVDGRKIGSAPPLKEYKVAPGKHKVEIHGTKPPNVYHFWIDVEPNEKKRLWAKFANAF